VSAILDGQEEAMVLQRQLVRDDRGQLAELDRHGDVGVQRLEPELHPRVIGQPTQALPLGAARVAELVRVPVEEGVEDDPPHLDREPETGPNGGGVELVDDRVDVYRAGQNG